MKFDVNKISVSNLRKISLVFIIISLILFIVVLVLLKRKKTCEKQMKTQQKDHDVLWNKLNQQYSNARQQQQQKQEQLEKQIQQQQQQPVHVMAPPSQRIDEGGLLFEGNNGGKKGRKSGQDMIGMGSPQQNDYYHQKQVLGEPSFNTLGMKTSAMGLDFGSGGITL